MWRARRALAATEADLAATKRWAARLASERGDALLRAEAAEAQVGAVEVLAKRWLRLSGQAMDADVREWTAAAGKSLLSALADPDGGGA